MGVKSHNRSGHSITWCSFCAAILLSAFSYPVGAQQCDVKATLYGSGNGLEFAEEMRRAMEGEFSARGWQAQYYTASSGDQFLASVDGGIDSGCRSQIIQGGVATVKAAVQQLDNNHTKFVVVLDPIEGSLAPLIATTPEAAGASQAKFVCEMPAANSAIIVIGSRPGAEQQADTIQSELERCNVSTALRIDAQGAMGPANQDIADQMKNALQNNIRAIVATDDETALAISGALQNNFANAHPPIIGFGGSADALQAISSGLMMATFEEDPVEIGKIAASTLYDLVVNGNAPAVVPVQAKPIVAQ